MLRVLVSSTSLALGLLLFAARASAATFCVDTPTELTTALNVAGSNGEHDVIQIKTGTYATASGANAFGYGTSQNFDLSVEGGWQSFLQFDCFRRVDDPTDTVLSGSGVRRILRFLPSPGTSGTISIENLTLRDGANVSESGGGLLLGSTLSSHNLRVERVFFHNNLAQDFGGGAAIATSGTVTLRNNLFFGNRSASAGTFGSAAHLTTFHSNSTTVRAFIGNNTVVANSCSAGVGTCSTGGFRIFGSARAVVFNNLFFGNAGDDVDLAGASADLHFNNLSEFNGTPANSSGNVDVADPMFENGLALDFRLRFTSPLRDAGTGAFALGAVDFNGLPRVNGKGVDIGAFENDEIVFANGFEVLQ